MNEQQIKDGQNCPRPGCQQNYADVKRLQSELDDEMAGRHLMAKATDRINDLESENARLQKDLKAEMAGRVVLTRTMERNQHLEAMITEIRKRNADLQYENAELSVKIRNMEEGTNATYEINQRLSAKNAKLQSSLDEIRCAYQDKRASVEAKLLTVARIEQRARE